MGKEKIQDIFEGWSERTYPITEPVEPPTWMDSNLLARGQKFARDHLFAISYAELLSLLFLFSYKRGLEPLIFTGRSGCVFSSFKRYLSTALRVQSWYETDLLDPSSEASRNLDAVRKMHSNVVSRMESMEPEELAKKTKVENPMTGILEHMKEDLSRAGVKDFVDIKDEPVDLSQWHMGFTQFGFVGLAVMHPEKLGIGHVPREDLEAFVHLWAVIGHFLGVQDKHNWCLLGLDALQERGHVLLKQYFLPSLKNVDNDWEHMSRAMTEGVRLYMPSVSLESLILFLLNLLNVPTNVMWKNSTWSSRFWYLFTAFMLKLVVYFPSLKARFNFLYKKGISVAKNADAKWLDAAEQRAVLREKKFKNY